MPEDKSPRPNLSVPSHASPVAKPADAEVVSLLAEFESSVDALKKLCSGKPRNESPSSTVPGSSGPTGRNAPDRPGAELRGSIETMQSDLKRRSAELDQKNTEYERVRRELSLEAERQKAKAAELAAQTQAFQNSLTQREEGLASKLAVAETVRNGVEAKLAELDRREKAFEDKLKSNVTDAKLVELNRRLADAQALAEHKSGELSEHRHRLEETQDRVASLLKQLQEAQSAVASTPTIVIPDPETVRTREKLEELLSLARKDLDTAREETSEHKLRAQNAEVALDDVRRQSARVSDATRDLHDANDQLKNELETLRHSFEESQRQAEISQCEHAEFLKKQETAAATIADLQRRMQGLQEIEPMRASIREEIEKELQAPFARAAERANIAENAAQTAAAELAALRTRHAEENAQLTTLQAQLCEMSQTLAKQDDQLAAQTSRFQLAVLTQAQLEQEIRAEQDQCRIAAQKVAGFEAQNLDLQQRTASLDRALGEAKELALRNEALAQRKEQELAAAQRRVTQLEGSAQELRTQFDFAGSRGEADTITIASLEHDLSAAQQRLEAAQQQHNSVTRELDETRVRFETERVSLQSALGDASDEREQAVLALSSMSNSLSEKNEQITILEVQLATANSLVSQMDDLRKDNSNLQAQVVESSNAWNAAKTRILELEANCQSTQAQINALQQQLSNSAPVGGDAQALKAKLELLKDRLRAEIVAHDADLERIDVLEKQIATRPVQIASPVKGPAMPPERIARLRIHRRLRREQAKKEKSLEESLRSRFEICEQLISQRSQLAVAQQMVNDAQRKVQAKQAGSRGGVGAFFAAMTVLILACLSWAAAGQLFPGRYASRVTIEADGRGRELPMDELKEWQHFHEEMLVSPGFNEKISEHMRKFGIASLSTPNAVEQRLKSDLTTESATPGQLIIELRGDGAAKTTRELNALATRFASEAQEMRTRRNDGAITTITKPAAALPESIDSSRLIGAAGILGGTVSLAGLISWLLYRKLVSAKSKFETDIALAGMLDVNKWPDPTVGYGKKAA